MSFARCFSSLLPFRRRALRHKSTPARTRTPLLVEVLENRTTPAIHTWTGAGTNGLWSNAANWDTAPTVAEAATSNVVLNFPAVTNKTTSDDISGLIVDQLQLQATGYALTLSQTLTLRQGFDQSNSQTFQQISNTAGFTDTISGGTITTTTDAVGKGVPNADLNVGGTLTISSVLGGGIAAYDQSGSGTLVLSGANTFTGGFDMQGGTIVAQNAAALGVPGATAQTSLEPGVTLDDQANLGNISIIANNGVINGGQQFGSVICSTGSGTLGAAVSLNDSAQAGTNASFMIGGAGTLTLAGGIAGANGNTYTGVISKTGTGTTILSGTTNASNTTLTAGTLQVNGTLTSPVSVASGATLGGSGTVSSITGATGATVAPGLGTAIAPITLTSGAVDLTNSTFAPVISGTTGGAADQLTANGAITLTGATLSVKLVGAAVPVGQSITLINNTGTTAITGKFTGFAEGATVSAGGQNFRISYVGGTGNSVVLTALTAAPATPTTLSLSASASTSVVGTAVTITASVTQTTGGAPVTGGTVQFQVDGANSGMPVNVTNGQAPSAPLTLSVGTHTVTANYSGTSAFATSTATLAPALTVNPASTPTPTKTTTPTPTPTPTSTPSPTPTPTTAGAPAKLSFTASSVTVHAGKVLRALSIRVLDANGNPVKAGTIVHLHLKKGKLGGIVTVRTGSNGVAVFTKLKITTAGHLTLIATVAGLQKTATLGVTVK